MEEFLYNIVKEYGLFAILVFYTMFENKQREQKYQEREESHLEEYKVREEKYIEREEKYISVIEGLTKSSEKIESVQRDVSAIKLQLDIKGVK